MLKLSTSDTAFPAGSLVLVTGSSGFMASHIVDQLLLAGYPVRGTVRDEKKAVSTTELFSARHGAGKYSAVVVTEMSTTGAYDEAVKGVQGIIHSAADVSFNPDPNAVIPRSIAGVTSMMQSAANEPSVKSFVLTSSSMSCAGPGLDLTIDTSTWNDDQINEAWSVTSEPYPSTHATAVYGASKAEAEKAFWKFVKEERPNFRANAILPDGTIGEILNPQGSLSTGAWVRTIMNNGVDLVQHLPPNWYVNVKDIGRLHVAVLLSESVKNERIFGFAKPFTWNEVLGILRTLYPSKTFPDDMEGKAYSKMIVPTERSEKLLKDAFGLDGFISLEETIADNVKGMA